MNTLGGRKDADMGLYGNMRNCARAQRDDSARATLSVPA